MNSSAVKDEHLGDSSMPRRFFRTRNSQKLSYMHAMRQQISGNNKFKSGIIIGFIDDPY